jgi:hypothetical protein
MFELSVVKPTQCQKSFSFMLKVMHKILRNPDMKC